MGRFRRRGTANTADSPLEHHEDSARDSSVGAESRRRRHAIFYDVENTSSAEDVSHVMSKLMVDRAAHDTQLVAVGNWRVIGQRTGRLLASHGAELVHSAPSAGVRDWSDLRIAVDAGIWLGTARPGDILHIVSDDQAFDAVGDVAATLGVQFSRIKTREGRSPQREADSGRAAQRSAEPTRTRSRNTAAAPQNASQEDILTIVRRLTENGSSADGTTLDVLSNELKDAGFGRAPGSLRLITRLKRMKELQVGADGSIQLVTPEECETATKPREEAEDTATPRKRTRRGRRGGRRRNGRQRTTGADGSSDTTPRESAQQVEPTPVRY